MNNNLNNNYEIKKCHKTNLHYDTLNNLAYFYINVPSTLAKDLLFLAVYPNY